MLFIVSRPARTGRDAIGSASLESISAGSFYVELYCFAELRKALFLYR
jgi:hypothetical protein